MSKSRISFAMSGFLPVLLGVANPLLTYSVFVLAYFFRSRIKSVIGRIPLPVSLKLAVLIVITSLGLLEFLSWLGEYFEGSEIPALLHSQLFPDLILAASIYTGYAVAWLIILRFFRFSLWQVLITQGLQGLFGEGMGAIFVQGLVTFPLGVLLWAFIFFSYAPAVALPFMLVEDELHLASKRDHWIKYPLALILISAISLLFLAIWGNVVGKLAFLPPYQPIREHPFW